MTEKRFKPRADFAVLCGVSRAAVSKACAKGGRLEKAFDPKTKNIDIAHASAREYHLAKTGKKIPDARAYSQHTRGVAAGKEKRTPASKKTTTSTPATKAKNLPKVEQPEKIAEYLDMSLRDIVDKFGTDTQFIDWLKAVKEIENIRDKRLRNDERENKLIPRELMNIVVGSFERCFSLQLNDASKTISARLYSYVKAGRTVEDATQLVEDQIGAPIKDAKRRIAEMLKDYE